MMATCVHYDDVINPRVYYDGVIHSVNAVHGPSWVMIFDSEESSNG